MNNLIYEAMEHLENVIKAFDGMMYQSSYETMLQKELQVALDKLKQLEENP